MKIRNGISILFISLAMVIPLSSVSAQNVSSDKDVIAYSVASQISCVVDNTAKTITIIVPFGTILNSLTTNFQVSPFAQMYWGKQVAGSFVAGDLMASGGSYDYSITDIFVTVEAENHSFDYFAVSITSETPSTTSDLLAIQLDYDKWQVLCGPHLFPSPTASTAFTATLTADGANPWTGGTNLHWFTEEAYPNLDEVTFYFTHNGFSASLENATAGTSTSLTGVPIGGASPDGALDFDTNGDGVADALSLKITAQDGSTTTYAIIVVSDLPVVHDDLLSFGYPDGAHQPAGLTSDAVVTFAANNVINVEVNYWDLTDPAKGILADLIPTYLMSDYATGLDAAKSPLGWIGGPMDAQAAEVCSGTTAFGGSSVVLHVYAEDRTEISTWTINIKMTEPRTGNLLLIANFDGSISWGTCGLSMAKTVTGVVDQTAKTVTVTVPATVSSVTLSPTSGDISEGATVTPITALTDGGSITVTSEAGVANVYTLVIVNSPPYDAKTLIRFGFKKDYNTGTGLTSNARGVIDATNRLVDVVVDWNTDLYTLIPSFKVSPLATVYIANSDGSYYGEICSNTTPLDFSNSITLVVRAQDGSEERYDVTVRKEEMLTGNELINFRLPKLPMCIGPDMTSRPVYDGNNINLTVKYGTDVTSLEVRFRVSKGATAMIGNVPLYTRNVLDFSTPKTITVTAQNGDVETYIVIVEIHNTSLNSVALIKEYWFDADNNGVLNKDVQGEIDETAKTITLWIPWGTNKKRLVASFVLENEPWVRMARSEDLRIRSERRQKSGETKNDFTTPIAYTVYAEDCNTTVEYFVTVNTIPNTDVDISEITFNSYGCGCELVNEVDPYAKRVHVTLPYSMDLSDLAPYSIIVHPDATIETADGDSWNTKQDWTKGALKYVVTAPDGVSKATWEILVENPPCQETEITSFALPEIQVDPAALNEYYKGDGGEDHQHPQVISIDSVNHTVHIIVKKGAKLDKVYYERSISCGAEICCVSGNCVDNHYIDFSQSNCHICVVTAEDVSITQAWTICIEEIDDVCPKVTTWSVLAMNCEDSVAVQTNELGEVLIVHESVLESYDWNYVEPCNCSPDNLLGNPGYIEWLMDRNEVAKADAKITGAPIYVSTHGLLPGVYWAFSIDEYGNVSCLSKQKLYIDICEKEVSSLCELRDMIDHEWLFTLTEEVVITYEESQPDGNWKFVQSDDCGIMIIDRDSALATTYGRGVGLTNLKGTLELVDRMIRFIPICNYDPLVSSEGNVVVPIEVDYDDYYNNIYREGHTYQSMLVKIANPAKIISGWPSDYDPTIWKLGLDYYVTSVKYLTSYLISTDFNTNYIGTPIHKLAYYTGIRVDDAYYNEAYVIPRDSNDIEKVSGHIFYASPDQGSIETIVPGQCGTIHITLYNEGVGNLPITALYLDDRSGSDEFALINPAQVPFIIGSWEKQMVRVDFCPKGLGDETSVLIIEYGVGQIMEIPINGTTLTGSELDFCENFDEYGDYIEVPFDGWTGTNAHTMQVSYMRPAYIGKTAMALYSWNDGNLVSPPVIISGSDPILQYYEGGIKWSYSEFDTPKTIWISSDGKQTWTLIDSYENDTYDDVYLDANGEFKKRQYSLADYIGKTVYIKWEVFSTWNDSYWILDEICIKDRITTPIFYAMPDPIEFGADLVNADEPLSETLSVYNIGASVMPIYSIEIIDETYAENSPFSLIDNNSYPVEVHDGQWAFAYNGTPELNVEVQFDPGDIGVFNAIIRITYGMYETITADIPLNGTGISCAMAKEVYVGENWSPHQNSWWKYTAERFQLVSINSCHPNQAVSGSEEYAYDTWLAVYTDCEGTLLAENDDLEFDECPYNRASSGVTVPMNEGETIYIFWPWKFSSDHDDEGFYFNIIPSYPVDGDVCENAIPLTLPVINHFGSTVEFVDDYDLSPCSPQSNFMDGNDKVYSLTIDSEGYLIGNILGAYGSIHVLDACPKGELEKAHCKAYAAGPNGGMFETFIEAGSYFVIISTWAPPQTVDYLLNMSFREGSGIDQNGLTSSMSVFPNPNNGNFTVSIYNPDAVDLTIDLLSIDGKVVYSNNVYSRHSFTDNIDASSLAKGIYYLKINDGQEIKYEKIVIQ